MTKYPRDTAIQSTVRKASHLQVILKYVQLAQKLGKQHHPVTTLFQATKELVQHHLHRHEM